MEHPWTCWLSLIPISSPDTGASDGFALKHPEVRLEVTTEDRTVDLIEEGHDLVIRVNPAPDERLVGRSFLRDRLVVAASPKPIRPAKPSTVAAVVRGAGDDSAAWSVVTPPESPASRSRQSFDSRRSSWSARGSAPRASRFHG
ncbi:LysR substrate-binding domain-containing protein [Myxococcus fulvus]|uniref:LysR substrate-binding domain-containing protein n=1 Tax=Myxococcus fulvus TaxID=33 RepID=UPI003B9A0DC2